MCLVADVITAMANCLMYAKREAIAQAIMAGFELGTMVNVQKHL